MNTKTCKTCHIEKPLDCFDIRYDNHNHRHSCIDCRDIKAKQWYLENIKEIHKKSAKYRSENREKVRESYRNYYQDRKSVV